MITILVEGAEKSGKGHVIALIGKYLKSMGCNVIIQSENTHNGRKLPLPEQEHLNRLKDTKIVIKEMRTFDREQLKKLLSTMQKFSRYLALRLIAC